MMDSNIRKKINNRYVDAFKGATFSYGDTYQHFFDMFFLIDYILDVNRN